MAGTFSQYVKVNNAKVGVNIYHLPENISYDEAALIEPLSVSTHAKNRAAVKAQTRKCWFAEPAPSALELLPLCAPKATKP